MAASRECERTLRHLKENGVPARIPNRVRFFSVGDLFHFAPSFVAAMRNPDSDIFVLFRGPAEPAGDEAILRLGDGRSMALREGGFLVDEFAAEDAGVGS